MFCLHFIAVLWVWCHCILSSYWWVLTECYSSAHTRTFYLKNASHLVDKRWFIRHCTVSTVYPWPLRSLTSSSRSLLSDIFICFPSYGYLCYLFLSALLSHCYLSMLYLYSIFILLFYVPFIIVSLYSTLGQLLLFVKCALLSSKLNWLDNDTKLITPCVLRPPNSSYTMKKKNSAENLTA